MTIYHALREIRREERKTMLKDKLKAYKGEEVPKSGVGSFCGQIQCLEVPADWNEEEVDELARENCSCWEAGRYTRKKRQRELAAGVIRNEFGENGANAEQSVINMLTGLSEMIVDGTINTCVVDLGDGIKAKMSMTKKKASK